MWYRKFLTIYVMDSYWDIWSLRSYLYLFLLFSSAHTFSTVLTLSLNLFCFTRTRLSRLLLNILGITCLFWDVKWRSVNITINRNTPKIQLDLVVFFNLFRYSFFSVSYIVKLYRSCFCCFSFQNNKIDIDIKDSWMISNLSLHTCCLQEGLHPSVSEYNI